MALQNDDLLLVNRGGDSYKTKYSEVKGEFVEVAGDNMTGDLTLGTDKIKLEANGNITAQRCFASGSNAGDRFRGYSADSDGTKLTFRVDNNGTVRIAADDTPGNNPKIMLAASGSAEFAGDVYADKQFRTKNGYGAADSAVLGVVVEGSNGTANASIGYDGSATFAGAVELADFSTDDYQSWSGPGTIVSKGGRTGIKFYSGVDGGLNFYNYTTGSNGGFNFCTGPDGSAVKVVEIAADGSATFADTITCGGLPSNASRTRGVGISPKGYLQVSNSDSDGPLFLGYKSGTQDAVVKLYNDGSGEFAGGLIELKSSGQISSNRTTANGACFYGNLNGTNTSSILADGSATFAGDISLTTPASAQGSKTIGLTTTSGREQCAIRFNKTNAASSRYGTIEFLTQSNNNESTALTLNENGSAEFSGKVTSASTVSGDSATTLATKDYVDANSGGVNYSGAAAWASFDGRPGAAGTNLPARGSLNIKSITKAATGVYNVLFQTPMPNANYAITCGYTGLGVSQTVNGFTLQVYRTDSTATLDTEFASFAVHASNALPPKGGTGADSWADFDTAGAVAASFNASVAFVSTGLYRVTFTTPMPSANYAVVTGGTSPNIQITSKTANGFDYNTAQPDGAATNYGGSFAVHASNATLPFTITRDQLQSMLDLVAEGFTARVAELEAKVQALEADHTSLMNNNNGGY